MDHHHDAGFKQTRRASGSFTVQANGINTGNRGGELNSSLTRRVASAIVNLPISSAHAQEASFATDSFTIQNPAENECTGLALYNDSSFDDLAVSNNGGDLQVSDGICGGTQLLTVTRVGLIGVDTDIPEDTIHVSSNAPVTRFDAQNDTQVWRLLAGGGGYRVQDQTAGSVPDRGWRPGQHAARR